MEFVKHPKFSPDELHGKRVACCQNGDSKEFYFQVGKATEDGFYELCAMNQVLVSAPKPENKIVSSPLAIKLDQAKVDKIVKPESGSYCDRMGYEFAIILDSESESLAKA